MKKLPAFCLLLCLCLPFLTACHGARALDPFVMPEEKKEKTEE